MTFLLHAKWGAWNCKETKVLFNYNLQNNKEKNSVIKSKLLKFEVFIMFFKGTSKTVG